MMDTEIAKCKGKMHLFFGKHGERPQSRVKREAIAIALCLSCPLQDECRKAGAKEIFGVWGGTTEDDRGLLKR